MVVILGLGRVALVESCITGRADLRLSLLLVAHALRALLGPSVGEVLVEEDEGPEKLKPATHGRRCVELTHRSLSWHLAEISIPLQVKCKASQGMCYISWKDAQR